MRKKEKQNLVVIIGMIIMGIIAVTSIIAGSDSKDEKIKVPYTESSKVSEEFKTGFIEGCTEDPASSYEECSCAYDGLINHYGERELIEISIDYIETEELPAKAIEIMVQCMY